LAERPDQAGRVRGGGDQVIAPGRLVAATVTTHVAGDGAEARAGQRGELPPPGPPELREPVQHQDQRPLTALCDVEPAAVGADGPVCTWSVQVDGLPTGHRPSIPAVWSRE